MKHFDLNRAFSSKIVRGFIIAAIPLFVLFTAVPASAKKKVSNQRQEYINYAISLLKTPYVYGGHDPVTDGGLDCSGFVKYAAHKALGVETKQTVAAMWSSMETVSIHDREPGDLVFFKTTGTDRVSHVGIYLGVYTGPGIFHGKRVFISALSDGTRTGVRFSTLDNHYWRTKYCGSKRFLPSTESYNNAHKQVSPVEVITEEMTDGYAVEDEPSVVTELEEAQSQIEQAVESAQ